MISSITFAISLVAQTSPVQVAERYRDTLRSAQSISGSYTVVLRKEGIERMGSVAFAVAKNGRSRQTTGVTDEIFDGNMLFTRNYATSTYTVKDKRIFGAPLIPGLEFFIDNSDYKSITQGINLNSAVNSTFAGAEAVQILGNSQQVFISPSSSLPLGFVYEGGPSVTGTFNGLRLNSGVTDADFIFLPKTGERQVPVTTPGLIAVGSKLPTAANQAVRDAIRNMLADNKHAVLVFASRDSAASLDLMKGIASINRGSNNTARAMAISSANNNIADKFQRSRPFIPVVIDAATSDLSLATACGVSLYPTVIVVNQAGTVVHAEVGGMEGTLKSFLNNAGVRV